ncbi:MAG: hypothetical protein IJZ85_03260 [Lachnospiraceae bacterium]|nr:hypothetical protein [Lachnospiraceae bacterium]
MQKWEEKIIEREKALAEGREEGRQVERAEMIRSSMHKLMEKMNMTAEEALDFLEIPKDEWEKYLDGQEKTEDNDVR